MMESAPLASDEISISTAKPKRAPAMEASRRSASLYPAGFGLAAVALTVQLFRERGFLSRGSGSIRSALIANGATGANATTVDALISLLELEPSVDGPSALQRIAAERGCTPDESLLRAIGSRARSLENDAEATARDDWQHRADLYRLVGEMHAASAPGSPMTLERSSDALVASGDTLRLHGDLAGAREMYVRGRLRIEEAQLFVPPTGTEMLSRFRAKAATLESNIDAADSQLLRKPPGEA